MSHHAALDEPKLLATAVVALLLARSAGRVFGLAVLLGVVFASVAALTVGVLLLKLVAG